MMNKDIYWKIINSAKDKCADIDDVSKAVESKLKALPLKDIVKFQHIHDEYMKNAHTIGLWDAASVMNKGCCSDDGFHYFKPWLIAQGKDVYMDALKNPDSLADLSAMPTEYGYYELESLNYAAAIAYEELTDKNIYEAKCSLTVEEKVEICDEIEFEPTIDRPRKNKDIPVYLPKLYAKFVPGMSEPEEYHWNINSAFFRERIQYMSESDKQEWQEESQNFEQKM